MWDNQEKTIIGQPPTTQEVVELLKNQSIWLQQPNESGQDYNDRHKEFMGKYLHIRDTLGTPILKPNQDGTNTIVFSREIDIKQVRDEAIGNKKYITLPIKDGNGNTIGEYYKWFCPYHKREEEYMMRILNPRYPEGFLDKGGVLTDCLCVNLRIKEKATRLYKAKHPDKDNDKIESEE